MGFGAALSGIFSGGDTVKGALEGAGTLAKDMRSAITGEVSPEKKAELAIKAQELENQIITAQTEINKAEAKSGKMFVAGWRPFIGWTCGLALAFNYVIKPLVEWGFTVAGKPIILPAVDMNQLYPLVIALLGLGTMRTVEKAAGAQANH